jgi:predicted Zn-dependent protease
VGCATEAPKKELTLSEQIEVDTKKAQSLSNEFKQRVTFVPLKNAQDFMKNMVSVLLKKREEFQKEKITIEIHDDSDPKLRRFFSFPGTTLSVPISFLKKVEFENELAAALAFEMANIMNRFLAKKVEKQVLLGNRPQLFSKESVFNLTKEDRGDSIRLATNLLDESGYDTRGMASIFKRFSAYYVQETSSDLFQTQVAWMVREAQRAQNEFLPQMKPVVRSGEFIQFKKGLTKVRVHSDE